MCLRRIGLAASADDFDAAMLEYSSYRQLIQNAVPDMKRAERWSLFDARIHELHYAALRKVSETATPAAH